MGARRVLRPPPPPRPVIVFRSFELVGIRNYCALDVADMQDLRSSCWLVLGGCNKEISRLSQEQSTFGGNEMRRTGSLAAKWATAPNHKRSFPTEVIRTIQPSAQQHSFVYSCLMRNSFSCLVDL